MKIEVFPCSTYLLVHWLYWKERSLVHDKHRVLDFILHKGVYYWIKWTQWMNELHVLWIRKQYICDNHFHNLYLHSLYNLLLWCGSQKADKTQRQGWISLCHRSIDKIEFDHYILFSNTKMFNCVFGEHFISWIKIYSELYLCLSLLIELYYIQFLTRIWLWRFRTKEKTDITNKVSSNYKFPSFPPYLRLLVSFLFSIYKLLEGEGGIVKYPPNWDSIERLENKAGDCIQFTHSFIQGNLLMGVRVDDPPGSCTNILRKVETLA